MIDPDPKSKGPGPVSRLSHPVHELMEFGIVLLFGVKLTTVNDTREGLFLKHGRSDSAVLLIVTHLNEGVDVGIRSGFVHETNIGHFDPSGGISGQFQNWSRSFLVS